MDTVATGSFVDHTAAAFKPTAASTTMTPPSKHHNEQATANGVANLLTTKNEPGLAIKAASVAGAPNPGKVANKQMGSAVDKHFDAEVTELLGSVTTQNCPGTRTSARVIQKMKQDQTRPTTPPPNERELKKEEKVVQKTPSQIRAIRPTWSNLERNHFFDAINEFGKDFDAIGNYINAKLKRKCTTDVAFKTKDQVRQHFYQTFHKICKYIRFSDEIKKPAQELYALTNYGEMRRKLQFVSDKHFTKLKSLVYQGYVTVRCKGKNIRIKTPSCKALRRLNQLDDSLEDIRLPSKIDVIVSPANMEAFGRVQTIAQNPRVRTTVPLHKKLVTFIRTFQHKWRSPEMKLAEEEVKLRSLSQPAAGGEPANGIGIADDRPTLQDPAMCFLPKPGVSIHRPLLSITEYLSSVNICLSAYEDRVGVKVRGESLNAERPTSKRQRSESGSDKRSPDTKKPKQPTSVPERDEPATLESSEPDPTQMKSESSGDELNEELNELLSSAGIVPKKETIPSINGAAMNSTAAPNYPPPSSSPITPPSQPTVSQVAAASAATQPSARARRNANAKSARAALNFKPLISDEVMRCIRKGWTVSNAADITIGDLYVVLGHDSKLDLEYYWTVTGAVAASSSGAVALAQEHAPPLFTSKQSGMPYNPSDCDDPQLLKALTSAALANKLKHLLLIASLSERIRKRQCSCGHTCNANKMRMERDLATKTFISSKTFNSGNEGCGLDCNSPFRQPIAPLRRSIANMDPVKQLTSLTRPKLSRQVLVQRVLMPGGSEQQTSLPSQFNADFRRIGGVAPPAISQSKALGGSDADKSAEPAAASSHTTRSHKRSIPQASALEPGEATFTGSLKTSASLIEFSNGCSRTVVGQQHKEHLDSGYAIGDEQLDSDTPLSSVDSAYDDCSNTSLFNGLSPMHLLRDSTSNSRWLEENLNDFSLTSLLGHLDEINASRDILDPSSNLSVISESSVDFRHKFQEIAALMQSQDKD